MFSFRALTALSLFTALVIGCAQRESDVGADAITEQPALDFVVVAGTAAASANWRPQVSNGLGQTLQIGDAAGFNAAFALRFDPTTVLPDSYRVDSMVIRFRLDTARVWPESGAPDLHVRVREISESWREDSLYGNALPGRATYPSIDSFQIRPFDDSLKFGVAPDVWGHWVFPDTLHPTYGLLFEPASVGVLMALYSSEGPADYRMTMLIFGTQWLLRDTVWDDTTMYIEWPPSSGDYLGAIEDGYLAADSAADAVNRLIISQGYAQRAALYFPLDTLTRDHAFSVNRAELRLFADTLHPANLLYDDPGRSRFRFFKDGTIRDTLWLAHHDSVHSGLVATRSTSMTVGTNYYAFDVTVTVAAWVSELSDNGGFQILATEEDGYLARQVFHGSSTEDTTQRPQLLIWFTESSH